MPFLEEEAQVLSRKDSGDPPENPLQKRSLPREHPAAPAFGAVPLEGTRPARKGKPGSGKPSSFHSTSCCQSLRWALGSGNEKDCICVLKEAPAVGTHMLGWSSGAGPLPGRLWKQGMWAGRGPQVGGPGLWRTTKRPRAQQRCERKAIVLSFFPSRKAWAAGREVGGRAG